jgi:hypothetical protein
VLPKSSALPRSCFGSTPQSQRRMGRRGRLGRGLKVALVWLWCGFGVALVWLCAALVWLCAALVWLWVAFGWLAVGFGVALRWLWVALGGLTPSVAEDRKRGHFWEDFLSAPKNPRRNGLFHPQSSTRTLALYSPPAPRRPIRTQLGTPNRRASGPRFLPPCTRPTRGTPRSLPVVPLIGDKRYYGEAPMCIR